MISCKEMREADRRAIENIGIPGIVLMENAAIRVIENIDFHRFNSFLLICGVGNNGGDGLAIARHLFLRKKKVKVYILGDTNRGTDEFQINLNIIINLGVEMVIVDGNDTSSLTDDLKSYQVIIDSIFGIGLKREIHGLFEDVINHINYSGKYIISVDIPSGINGDTGEVMGVAIQADKTITFHHIKTGLTKAPLHTGEIIVEDIGIPHTHD